MSAAMDIAAIAKATLAYLRKDYAEWQGLDIDFNATVTGAEIGCYEYQDEELIIVPRGVNSVVIEVPKFPRLAKKWNGVSLARNRLNAMNVGSLPHDIIAEKAKEIAKANNARERDVARWSDRILCAVALRAADELGGGTARLQSEVRDDLRRMDARLLARTIASQLYEQLIRYNLAGIGAAPRLVAASDNTPEDKKAIADTLAPLAAGGLEPDDDALPGLSDVFGFKLRRRAPAPAYPMAGLAANAFSGAGNARENAGKAPGVETEGAAALAASGASGANSGASLMDALISARRLGLGDIAGRLAAALEIDDDDELRKTLSAILADLPAAIQDAAQSTAATKTAGLIAAAILEGIGNGE